MTRRRSREAAWVSVALPLALVLAFAMPSRQAHADDKLIVAPPGLGAEDKDNPSAPPGLGEEEEETNLLTIAGDDSSATTIIPRIVKVYLQFRGAGAVEQSEADPPWHIKMTGTMLNGKKVAVLIRAKSSTDGLFQLAGGVAHVGVTLRMARPGELPGLTGTSPAQAAQFFRPIALNALVLVANKAIGVKTLTFDQARGIFSGAITDWKEVGGRPGKINKYGHAIDHTIAALVDVASENDLNGPKVLVEPTYAATRDAVERDPNAIGLVPVNLIDQGGASLSATVQPIRFRLGDRYTAMPDEYGIATEDYPLVFPILLYRVPDRDDPEVDTFFQLAVSVSARVIDMFDGLTSVEPQLLVPRYDATLPPAYAEIVRNALRISTTVRFEAGTTNINSRTKHSFDSLAAFLRRLDISPERLRHLVFSEDTGDGDKNVEISRGLGAVFQRELRARNVRVGEIVPLGATLPLAASDSDAGQWLNRRVETWVMP
jgi:phosphate transport system substrate-binding protein